MTARIRLMVNSGSGVLAAVASQLQASGVRVKSHNLESMSNTSALLTLDTEAADFDQAALTTKLTDIGVVQSVEDISVQGRAPAPEAPKVKAPDELVDRIVAAFPKIMSHVQSYEEKVAKDPDKETKLRNLGVAVGAKLVTGADTGSPESKAEAIDQVILPGIGSIAEASRKDDTIVVPISLFTRRMVTSMDLFSGDDENCFFLCGVIEGMASSVPACGAVSVEETRCRANGDSACIFSLN